MSEENKNLCLPENPEWISKERNVGEFLLKYMQLNKGKIAQIDAESGKSVTYDMMLAQTISVAKEMKKQGLVEDDIISVCSRNSLENCLPILASFFLGIKPTSLDPSLSLNDIIHLINLIKPRMIFCESDSLDLIESAITQTKLNTKIVIFGDTDNHLSFNSYLNDSNKIDVNIFQIESKKTNEDTALISYSSGSTSSPKGICLSNYGLLYQINMIAASRPLDININFASTYWISAILLMLATIFKGATRIICPSFEVEKCLKYIEKYKIGNMTLSTSTSFAFTETPELCSKYDHSTLKYISMAGGSLSEEHLKTFRSLFPSATIVNIYGMTEISGPAVVFNWYTDNDLRLKKGVSCGRPVPGIHLKVVDLHTEKPVGPYETGELKIKTKTIMKGYYNSSNMKEYARQFDEEQYFSTGDIVYYDEDYCFYVVDRIKEMLKFQCWQVTPTSIESVLLTHPNILEAVVIGVPHKTDGEHPAAVVVLKPNSSVTSNEIIQYVEERVSDRQRLRGGVKFVENLLRTPSGKLRRLEMRQMIINREI